MATFTFDGTTSQTVAFNATVDRAIFNLDAADLAAVTQDEDNNTVTFVAVSGAVFTLTGTNFAAFNANLGSVQAGFDSDITFAFGTDGADPLVGNVVAGLDGADVITSNAGDVDGALLLGNEGNDTFTATGESVRIYGGQGVDVVNYTNADSASASLIVGGLGNDDINVTAGYAGDITIFGGNEAGDASDTADTIDVGLVDGATATIFGNGGADIINVTGTGSASVYGGQGADVITAAVNSGLFVGGLGGDTLDVTLVGADASVTIIGGNEAGDPTDGADTIDVTSTVDGGSAVIFSNGGNDDIDLNGAFDTQFSVYSGQGNDNIAGIIGGDSEIYAGLGLDVVDVTVDGDGSSVSVYGGNGSADAADGADAITVTLGANVGAGAGTLRQTAEIYGNGGNDVITINGEGSASVFGGAGDDEIVVGGTGRYTLTGGTGSDEFDVSGFTFTPAGAGADVEVDVPFITDFAFGTDTIQLPALNGNVNLVSDQTAATFTQGTLSAAAEAAFDAGFGQSAVGTGAVLFNYQGDSYIAFGENETETLVGGVATPIAEVDGFVKVTGFTGSIGVSSFEA